MRSSSSRSSAGERVGLGGELRLLRRRAPGSRPAAPRPPRRPGPPGQRGRPPSRCALTRRPQLVALGGQLALARRRGRATRSTSAASIAPPGQRGLARRRVRCGGGGRRAWASDGSGPAHPRPERLSRAGWLTAGSPAALAGSVAQRGRDRGRRPRRALRRRSLAVDGSSFTAERGQVARAARARTAPGKTTTVETLEGYRRPAAGTVRVLGLDPSATTTRAAPARSA